jgi:hypothetical protein
MEKISTETKTSTRRISSRSSSSSTRRKSPHKKNKSVSKKMKQNAISWLLHSIKILLGDESIRRYIILKYNPELKNKNHIKTFDAFIKSGKTREHKHKEIKKYLQAISRLKKDIVSTKKDNSYKYDLIYLTPKNGIRYMYSKINNKGHFGVSKIIIGETGMDNAINDWDGKYGMTQDSFGIIIDSKEEGDKILGALKTEEFKKIISELDKYQ